MSLTGTALAVFVPLLGPLSSPPVLLGLLVLLLVAVLLGRILLGLAWKLLLLALAVGLGLWALQTVQALLLAV